MIDLTFVLEALVGATFLLLAAGLVLRAPRALAPFRAPPTRRLARLLLAVLTALPGFGMIVATVVPFLAFFAAMLAVFVGGGLGVAGRSGGWPARATALVVVFASLGVAALQPLGLKVLCLPRAESLPEARIVARVVNTYAAGVGFEGVTAGPDGTLYLATSTGLDFTSGAYYRHAHGQIIARRADGSERVVLTTPVGSTAGVIAVAPDGTLFMTSNGRNPGIWRVAPGGKADKLVDLPTGAWPNGLDFGPDGMLYSPDSSLAQIWRIDPASGKAEVALHDRRLAARALVALAPGANGLHFAGRDMIVTVSDSTEVLKYRLGADGRFGAPVLVARGIPGDDFAIGQDGSLFITTHPYNTLVRVARDGRRTLVADAREHIIGATAASFGRGPADRNTLYVATDGGAFTAGASARGQLIALQPTR